MIMYLIKVPERASINRFDLSNFKSPYLTVTGACLIKGANHITLPRLPAKRICLESRESGLFELCLPLQRGAQQAFFGKFKELDQALR